MLGQFDNVYSSMGSRRDSFTTIPSSKYTDNDFACMRDYCHCGTANREYMNEDEPSKALSPSERKTEYFYRPPVLSIHHDCYISDESPYNYFRYQKPTEPEYCEQCQFCSASSKWCGRLSSNGTVKVPRSFLSTPSEVDFYGSDSRILWPLSHSTWVQEPLMANSVQGMDENAPPAGALSALGDSFALTCQWSTDVSQSVILPKDVEDLTSNISLESLKEFRTITQHRAQSSAYLRSFRDVRCTLGDTWAIKEGSLVIGLPWSFVDLPQNILAPDEFERRDGEVYVVCLMCADMWALCARLRLSESVSSLQGTALQNNLKFLPLCSVTLAANYGAFKRRYANYKAKFPNSRVFPSGGLCIRPPERRESLRASHKNFQGYVEDIPCLPQMVSVICKAADVMPANKDYEQFEVAELEVPSQSPPPSPGPPPADMATTPASGSSGLSTFRRRLLGKYGSKEPESPRTFRNNRNQAAAATQTKTSTHPNLHQASTSYSASNATAGSTWGRLASLSNNSTLQNKPKKRGSIRNFLSKGKQKEKSGEETSST